MNNYCNHISFAVSTLQKALTVKNFIWCRKKCPLDGVSPLRWSYDPSVLNTTVVHIEMSALYSVRFREISQYNDTVDKSFINWKTKEQFLHDVSAHSQQIDLKILLCMQIKMSLINMSCYGKQHFPTNYGTKFMSYT